MQPVSLLLSLWACGSPAGPSVVQPTGTILVVQGQGDDLQTVVYTAPGFAIGSRTLEKQSYPSAPDPRGTHSAQIRITEVPEHIESLWLTSLADTSAVQLTQAATKVRNPSWSQDGSWLAFESDAESYRDLYRINRDGTGIKRLTDQKHGSFEPHISPAGLIVFGTSRNGNAEVYTMEADGTNPRRLTNHPADDVHPRWSPDGTQIAWISSRQGGPAVWRMTSDGSGAKRIKPLSPGSTDVDFAWSPDSSRVAVVTRRSANDLDIQLVHIDTGELFIVGDPGVSEHPAWSPDSKWIAYTSHADHGGNARVMLTAIDGTHITTICQNNCWLPRWLP